MTLHALITTWRVTHKLSTVETVMSQTSYCRLENVSRRPPEVCGQHYRIACVPFKIEQSPANVSIRRHSLLCYYRSLTNGFTCLWQSLVRNHGFYVFEIIGSRGHKPTRRPKQITRINLLLPQLKIRRLSHKI